MSSFHILLWPCFSVRSISILSFLKWPVFPSDFQTKILYTLLSPLKISMHHN
jgi:hypothetical protein